MKVLWIVGTAALALSLSFAPVSAAPDHCPPSKHHQAKRAVHKPVKHHQHRKQRHYPEPRYYDEETPPPPSAPPPPPPRHYFWRDGYGKVYDTGPRPWAPPPPCPCPPRHDGGLPDFCHFNVWYGFDRHYGLESGL